ncbi:MAG: hypothetical protein HRU05_01120 [Oceanospirillaceae bacterium]|nr:hypothetical protein [Oceanospirillaceae bacterium]
MSRQQADPVQVVSIVQEIKAKRSVTIHWGTYPLTSEPFLTPAQRLQEPLKNSIQPRIVLLR